MSQRQQPTLDTLSFHPVFMERTLPKLEEEPFCLSAIVPLDRDETRAKPYMLKVRAAVKELEEKLKERAGVYPHFDDAERKDMLSRLASMHHIKEHDVRPFLGHEALAIYITPDHTLLVGLPESAEAVTLVAKKPYKLPLLESAHHFYQNFFYLIDLSKDGVTLHYVNGDGESELMVSRDMNDEIDFQPAAGYADNEDEPLQFHSTKKRGREATFHGHASREEAHDEARQKRFFRDAYEEILSVVDHAGTGRPSDKTPVILRGERRQRDAFFHKVDASEDDFAMITNLQEEGSFKEQMLALREEIVRQRAKHAPIDERWERATGQGRTETETTTIAKLAARGMIDTLLVSNASPLYGEYDMETGDLLMHDNERMSSGELRDMIARKVMELGGQVHIFKEDAMPSKEPFAAILRGEVA